MRWRWWQKDPAFSRLEQRNEWRATEEAQQAREQAEHALEVTVERGAEVTKVSATLRRLGEDNFTILVEQSMRRRP